MNPVHFILLDGTSPDDCLVFQCQVCKQKITEGLTSHSMLHGVATFTADIATATRKMRGKRCQPTQ